MQRMMPNAVALVGASTLATSAFSLSRPRTSHPACYLVKDPVRKGGRP